MVDAGSRDNNVNGWPQGRPGRRHGLPRSPRRLRNDCASLASSARFRIGVRVLAGGTPSGYPGSPPPPTASRHVLGRAATPRLGAGPTPLIGLRGGCNGLIALLLGLLAADALGRHFLLHPLHSQFGKSASRDPHAGSPHPWRAAHGPIWSGGSDPAGTPRQEPRRRGRYAGRSLTPSTITLLLASATGHDRFGIISGT
jgi:hypothetical protein